MQKIFCFLGIFLIWSMSDMLAWAWEGGKVIIINQANQTGAAYENGRLIMSFPVLSGDDETPTRNGTYNIERKVRNYFSRRYRVPMPYSLFFDGGRAIHEGWVPRKLKDRKEKWATHGCVHVEMPIAKKLFQWAEEKKTKVIIRGER
jgi:lipoprotein-anchoring transpeptidase ErfK/SrfK